MKLLKLFCLFLVWHYQVLNSRQDETAFLKYLNTSDHCYDTSVKEKSVHWIIVGYLQPDDIRDLYDVYYWKTRDEFNN